jgi:4-aminobutyrate aminotransferase-like enzyme
VFFIIASITFDAGMFVPPADFCPAMEKGIRVMNTAVIMDSKCFMKIFIDFLNLP